MRITEIKTVLLTGPCTNDPFLSEARKLRSAAFVEIYTDSEHVGLGESYAGYFIPEIIPQIVAFFAPILVGQEVDDVERLWQRMYHCGNFWCRVGVGLSALTAIEAALWDLQGKAVGLPVYELLGGRQHEHLPCYATGGPSNYPKEKLVQKIDHYRSLGFKGVKLGAGCYDTKQAWSMPDSPEDNAAFEADKLAFVRSHAGDDLAVMIDGHMGNSFTKTWDLETAVAVMRAVEPYNLLFFEEPLHYTDAASYAELCRVSKVPIAGGECLTGLSEWKTFHEGNCFQIGQPDASFVGGLGEFTKVARMFETTGKQIATHAWGAGGSLLQNIHCGFACRNTLILEFVPDYGGLHSDLIAEKRLFEDGVVFPPQEAGLGISLTNEVKNKYPFIPGSGEFNSVPGKILTM